MSDGFLLHLLLSVCGTANDVRTRIRIVLVVVVVGDESEIAKPKDSTYMG